MSDAKIIGTGIYVPERVVTNADLSANLGVDIDEFVSTIVGIRQRHIAADDESAADLATNAALAALEDAALMLRTSILLCSRPILPSTYRRRRPLSFRRGLAP